MKSILRKAFVGIMATLCLVTNLYIPSFAASGRISFNDPTVTVGDTVTVTMTVKGSDCALGAIDAALTYDTGLLEYQGSGSSGVTGGSGSISISWWDSSGAGVDSVSFSFKFKAKAAGTAVIKPTMADVSSIDYESITLSSYGSSTVTVNPVPTASSEARLSSLKVSPGTLSPGFDPDTYSYSLTVPAGTTKLTVSAKAKDDGASVSVSGTKLSVGTNTVTITVTAEDKSTKKYTIQVTRPADPVTQEPDEPDVPEDPVEPDPPVVDDPVEEPLIVVIDGVTWYVDEAIDSATLPEGFEKTLSTYQEREVAVAKGLDKELLLFYLTDEAEANGAFFIYNAADGSFVRYQELACAQKIYTLLPLPEGVVLPEGYVENAAYLMGAQTVTAYVSEADGQTALVYAMNWDGECALYRYDAVEQTMQRYLGLDALTVVPEADPALDEELTTLQNEKTALEGQVAKLEEAQSQNDLRLLILFCVAAAELLILIIVIIVVCARKKSGKKPNGYQGSRSA